MGEKRGVEGVERVAKAIVEVELGFVGMLLAFECPFEGLEEVEGSDGNELWLEVTSMDFSTARRYFPTDL